MAVNVNPPLDIRIPESLLSDNDLRVYNQQIMQVLFDLYTRTGGSSDFVSQTQTTVNQVISQNVFTQFITTQIPKNELTADTDSFTADSTLFSADMTET